MQETLTLRYRLVAPGWSVTTISDGERWATLRASYHSDALGDLARAVLALLHGDSYTTCTWLEEPGEYRWFFDRDGAEVQLTIAWFDDWELYRNPHDQGTVLFTTRCPLPMLAHQVWRQLHHLWQGLGAERYRERWIKHAFPHQEYTGLSMAAAPDTASTLPRSAPGA